MTLRIPPLTLIFCLALGTHFTFAQMGPPSGGGHEQDERRGSSGPSMGDRKEYLEDRMAELEEELGLSGAQAVAIQMLHQEFFAKLESAQSSGGDQRAMMNTMRMLRDETDEEVVKMLSDEQALKYREIRRKEIEKMESRMQSRGGVGGKPGRP